MSRLREILSKDQAGVVEKVPEWALGNFSVASTSGERTLIYYPFVDAQKGASGRPRHEMVKKSLWAYDNISFVGGIVDRSAEMCAGMMPRSRSGDAEWDRLADAAFERVTGNPEVFDLAGKHDWEGLEESIYRTKFLVGDGGVLQARAAGGQPRVKLYEGTEINNDGRRGEKEAGWKDGLLMDAHGKALRYRFPAGRMGERGGVDLARRDFIFYADYKRARQHRGLPKTHRLISHVHDSADIIRFMKGGVKGRNALPFVIEDSAGDPSVPSIGAAMAQARRKAAGDGAGEATGPLEREALIEGPTVPRLRQGERLSMPTNTNPGANELQFLDYLKRDMSMGYGLPVEVVWNLEKLSSANTRGAFLHAMQFVMKENRWFRTFLGRRLRNWIIAVEMKEGRLREPNAGADWWLHDWVPGPKMTADFAKDARAMLELVNRGEMPEDDLAAFFGRDRRASDEKHLRAIRERMERAKEMGVPFDYAFPKASGTNYDQAAMLELLEQLAGDES